MPGPSWAGPDGTPAAADQRLPEVAFGDRGYGKQTAHRIPSQFQAGALLFAHAQANRCGVCPIKALLVFRGADDADRQGAGFDRVRAFREGVINGAEACVGYEH
ncbi:hypothetical protein SBI67_21135 [Mycolicibacterium sp. 120266]|uniref:hypothetical protein n=1 Tax=Mycolicibacterium sp. 120266 TaxID=3090601 RepID=UPI00299F1869|nr:hypothetical protein [Mycolicibacterium sp. 120266]MDX1874631.1 hypothetical protein [Mycolicibacterium sp. 120266]